MNSEVLENLNKLKKMLVLLSEERKVVMSHHKTFEHVEKMRDVVNKSIELFNKKLQNPNYVIFSFKDNEILKKLNIAKEKVVFINDETIQCENIEKLLMMSNFKNFIISNSSFYWWAAYFAEMKYGKINIVPTNNFFDNKTVPNRWKTLD